MKSSGSSEFLSFNLYRSGNYSVSNSIKSSAANVFTSTNYAVVRVVSAEKNGISLRSFHVTTFGLVWATAMAKRWRVPPKPPNLVVYPG